MSSPESLLLFCTA